MGTRLLGDWLNPEQFLSFDEQECPFDDSIKAYNHLVNVLGFPKDIMIFPVEFEILDGIEYYSYLFWEAFDVVKKEICTFLPAFYIKDYENFIERCEIVNVNLLKSDRFFVWNDTFSAVIYTSTGQMVIRKINGIWTEIDAKTLINIKSPELDCPDIYPVELFSKSEHKFICAAWAVDDAENEYTYWYPIQWSDEELLEKYGADDLSELPLNVGDVTRAGDVKLEMLYSHEYGVYFAKTSKSLPEHITTDKYIKLARDEKAKLNLKEANIAVGDKDETEMETKEIKFVPKIRENTVFSQQKVISMFPET